jgi:hypothetical protein
VCEGGDGLECVGMGGDGRECVEKGEDEREQLARLARVRRSVKYITQGV